MEYINSGDESDHDLISMEMLEDIRDRSQTHTNVQKKKHVIKYMIVLGKENRNGKERQKLCEAWEKVYTRYLVRL